MKCFTVPSLGHQPCGLWPDSWSQVAASGINFQMKFNSLSFKTSSLVAMDTLWIAGLCLIQNFIKFFFLQHRWNDISRHFPGTFRPIILVSFHNEVIKTFLRRWRTLLLISGFSRNFHFEFVNLRSLANKMWKEWQTSLLVRFKIDPEALKQFN